jgi:phage-related minor tail protein
MVTSNEQLYSRIRELIAVVGKAGEDALAAKLTDALTASTLPGEILGEVRLQIQELESTELSKRLNIQRQIKEAIEYIDSVLGE